MNPGDDPILATAVFIATDNLGKLIVHRSSIEFDVGLYDSQGKIAVSETQRFDLPENNHVTGDMTKSSTNFSTKPASEQGTTCLGSMPTTSLSSEKQNANLASKVIELSILLHPKNQELGFPIDLIQMNRTVGLQVLSMKPEVGRARLDVDREQVIEDRRSGLSLTQVAKKHGISRASVCRLMKEANGKAAPAVLVGDGIEQQAHV